MSIARVTLEGYDRFYRDAFEIVSRPQCRGRRSTFAARIQRMRDRYGRDSWGQSALLARRLVEAGVTFVTVNVGGWDTHNKNFNELKEPPAAALTTAGSRLSWTTSTSAASIARCW